MIAEQQQRLRLRRRPPLQQQRKQRQQQFDIVVAMPAYNVEPYIGSVVLKARKYADKVIVVDDGSEDATAEVAKLAGATVVRHKINMGYGTAIRSCFETAKKYEPEILITLDSDGQHNPDEIPRIIDPIKKGEADLVIGSRFLTAESIKKIPRMRRLGLRVLTYASNIGSKDKITDSQSGYRAYSRIALQKLKFRRRGMSVGSEILLESRASKLRIKEIPITCIYEGVGKSTESQFKHGFSVLNFTLKIIRQRHPLIFFGLPGTILLLLGVVFGILTMHTYYTGGGFPVGKALLSVLLVLLGVLGLFAAIVLDALRNIVAGIR